MSVLVHTSTVDYVGKGRRWVAQRNQGAQLHRGCVCLRTLLPALSSTSTRTNTRLPSSSRRTMRCDGAAKDTSLPGTAQHRHEGECVCEGGDAWPQLPQAYGFDSGSVRHQTEPVLAPRHSPPSPSTRQLHSLQSNHSNATHLSQRLRRPRARWAVTTLRLPQLPWAPLAQWQSGSRAAPVSLPRVWPAPPGPLEC